MAKNVTARIRNRQIVSRLHAGDEHAIAAAYNQAGDKYEAYPDGDLQDPNSFQGQYAYATGCGFCYLSKIDDKPL
jgi:hypothetical protein